MIGFPIEFINKLITKTLHEEHIENPNYFGGDNQINIKSFYEQLSNNEEVERFVETYRELTKQQNRSYFIGNGIILSPENPTITNIREAYSCPLTYTMSIRTTIGNRDQMIETLNNLITKLKGKKFDMFEFKSGKVFKVGTIGNGNETSLVVERGQYIGAYDSTQDYNTQMRNYFSSLTSTYGFTIKTYENANVYFYFLDTYTNKLKVVVRTINQGISVFSIVENNASGNYGDIIFPYDEEVNAKYKVSISLEAIRVDEPKTLNAYENINITLGGSATVVSENVMLGNDLLRISIKAYALENSNYSFPDTRYYIEPLELPNSANPNSQMRQLMSNGFLGLQHTDAMNNSIQYSSLLDTNNAFLTTLFKCSRYGLGLKSTRNYIVSPNIKYEIIETWVSFGVVEQYTYYGKLASSIDVENTESDVLSISFSFNVEG